jgi:transcriptional regulator EpsA
VLEGVMQFPAAMHGDLLRVLESAPAIRHRGDLFLWVQGQLQALVPHGLLFCLVFQEDGQLLYHDCLQGLPIDPDVLDRLGRPDGGFVMRLAKHCLSGECEAGMLDVPATPDCTIDAALVAEWAGFHLGPLIYHGSGALADGSQAIFVFIGLEQLPTEMQVDLIRLVIPQIYIGFSRARRHAVLAAGKPAATDDGPELTGRQLEIMRWVKLGKTNYEIARILEISELTVKNHMQKVFKKLGVNNRVQAIARVMERKLD